MEFSLRSLVLRPEIDGLRAFAVIPVILFHLNPNWMPGGFVGVDIFFVISGYLITSILQKTLESGSYSLATFYRRRFVRLMPTFLTSTLVTLIIAIFLYGDQDIASVGAITASTCAFAANFKFMLQGNYFELPRDSVPLLHHWSLAVEEQFYLVFPGVLYVLNRCRFRGHWLTSLLLVCTAISFILSLQFSYTNPRFAFYMLPCRAWEMLIGSCLAVAPGRVRCSSRAFTSFSRLLAITLLTASILLCREDRPHPGVQAVLPVFGTWLFILLNWENSTLGWIFTNRVATYIGRASYSLYLWHWPVLCFVDYSMFMQSNLFRGLAKVVLTIIFSLGCFEFIEQPWRFRYLEQISTRLVIGGALACLLGLAMLGTLVRNEYYVDSPPSSISTGGIHFYVGPTAANIALVGDSQGSMYGSVFRDVARILNVNASIMSVAAGDPLPKNNDPQTEFWANIQTYFDNHTTDVVFVACAWRSKLQDQEYRVETLVSYLLNRCKKVVLLTEIPSLPLDANRAGMRAGARPPFFEPPEIQSTRIAMNQFILEKEGDRVSVIDVDRSLVSQSGELLLLNESGRLNWQDKTHLSGSGARIFYGAFLNQIKRDLTNE